jgi:hypothetical protein
VNIEGGVGGEWRDGANRGTVERTRGPEEVSEAAGEKHQRNSGLGGRRRANRNQSERLFEMENSHSIQLPLRLKLTFPLSQKVNSSIPTLKPGISGHQFLCFGVARLKIEPGFRKQINIISADRV